MRLASPVNFLPHSSSVLTDGEIRRACAGAFKQMPLGREIIIESLVEIDMVAGQIGEDSGGEMASPQAIHGERMGTCFQTAKCAAGVANLGKKLLQVD